MKYGIALVAAALAILFRAALTPWMGQSFPLATIFPAVAFVVWSGGWGPALVTALAGWVASAIVFGRPYVIGQAFALPDAINFAAYMLANGSLIAVAEAMRAAQHRLEQGRQQLSTTNLALENQVEAQSLLAAIVASSDDAIISKTLQGVITSWNRGAERLFGYSAPEAIGQPIHIIIPADQREQERVILERISRGERVDHLEVERVRKDGTPVHVSLTISPVHDRHGRVIGASKTARDITERKRWEAAIMRNEEALREADRRKDEFLATLAHELRNPLAPLSSGLHILRAAPDDAAAAAARAIMERQVAQMVRLVDDLLDVARITTGKVELRSERLDLAAAVTDAAEMSRPLIESAAQPFTVDVPAEPIYVHADRTRLAQVFANLLNNSAKFSARGQPIAITLAREGGQAVVRVRDAGAGIHPDMLPRVFEMFRQADHTGGRARGGLGIGLSLVKGIVELHGGTVEATSAGLGLGSEFVVRIPTIDAAGAAAGRAEPAADPTPARRILVVDDNTDAAQSLAQLLRISGHDTRLAHDGPEAVDAAAAFQPDVVFLDIGLPTLDGHETARRIRQQPWAKDVVLVALTGWGQAEDRRRSRDAGFNHHLVKPADPAVVAKLLASLGA